MAKEICISSTPHETRLAILEDDQLAEIYYERENEYTLAGSIYNGRVTRVLPGMQSAFVDIGLERDAFLYVTDFLEMEDPEEADELEKAAVSGSTVAPREVRSTPGQGKTGRPEQNGRTEAKPTQRQEPKPAPQQRFAVEAVPPVAESLPAGTIILGNTESSASGEEDGPGAKRWRGRRRRRGGRGPSGGTDTETETQAETEPALEAWVAPEIHAASAVLEAPAEPVSAPVPFVLPGESLSKYGGVPAEVSSQPAVAAPARPASTYKPATLIESPIEWDGSGLLPGESISRHRTRPAMDEPSAEVNAEPQGVFSDAVEIHAVTSTHPEIPAHVDSHFEPSSDHATVHEELIEEAHELASHVHQHFVEEELDDLTEETAESSTEVAHHWTAPAARAHDDSASVQIVAEFPSEEGHSHEESHPQIHEHHVGESTEPEPDADASHRVDPIAPTGFRLFGLGKKKKEDEAAKAATVSSVSAGASLLEEDFIEEEEFAASHPQRSAKPVAAKAESQPTRAQEIGRLQLEAEGIDSDDAFDEDEDEDEPTAGAQPSAPDAQRQQSRDRNGRARRGRGGPQQGGPTNRRGGPTRRSSQLSDLPVISDLLKPGQEILVQIAKEPIAKKGARITSHIALPGRFLVFMPTVSHVGVSRKIESDEERQRLKRILISERGEASGGFIVRTAAEGASEEELRADLRFLLHLWNEIKNRSDSSKSPALIYHDLSLIERILRDQVSSNFSNIWVDSEADYERIVRFLNRFSPTLVRRVKLYTKEAPLFEHFGIQDEISKALRSKVWLKSGGSIVINQTEALVAIDINTGKFVGKSARLEDTIVKTNLDAVPEIVRQIRLRDLGGIIVIDFIDMDDRKNRFRVMAALEEALKSDRAPTKVLQFNDFGLVAITRKRVKQSLERTLSVPCPTCQATGMVKSPTTVCNEIYMELRKMKKHFDSADVMLRVHPETVKVLKSNNASWLVEFEELTGKNILVKSDASLNPEQFDIQG